MNLFKPKGVTWALSQFIGKDLLNMMCIPDRRKIVKEVADRFSITETGLTRLIAAKLNLLFVEDIEKVNAEFNFRYFRTEELRSKAFVLYSASLETVKILCYDPERLGNFKLKGDRRKVELALTTWPTISKLIDQISESYLEEAKAKSNDNLLWGVFGHLIKNVADGNGNSFEIAKSRGTIKYIFVDSALATRCGDIDSLIGTQLIEFLTTLSYKSQKIRQKIANIDYLIEITPLTSKGSVFICFKKDIFESDLISPPYKTQDAVEPKMH